MQILKCIYIGVAGSFAYQSIIDFRIGYLNIGLSMLKDQISAHENIRCTTLKALDPKTDEGKRIATYFEPGSTYDRSAIYYNGNDLHFDEATHELELLEKKMSALKRASLFPYMREPQRITASIKNIFLNE